MNLYNILRFLQTVDRRFLYAMLLLVVCIPFFLSWKIPVPVSPQTESLYKAIEALPEGSMVFFSPNWGAGSRGENRPQTIALLHHIMKKKLHFMILTFEPSSKALIQPIVQDISKQYGYREGIEWANFGYKVSQEDSLKAMANDVPGFLGTDIHGQPAASLPVMKGIKTPRDFKFLIDITPSSTYETYIQFLQGPFQIPMGLAPTSVMAPEAFNRLDAHQLVGMINGLQGAVEYEQKLGLVGRATRASVSLSFAHLLIIAFIILGNIAMLLERRQRRMAGLEG